MGTDNYEYLGVYLKVEYNIEIDSETASVCPNGHKFSGFRTPTFCSDCGSEIIEKSIPKPFTLDFEYLAEVGSVSLNENDFSSIRTESNAEIWLIENLRDSEFGRTFDIEYGSFPIDGVVVSETLDNFKEKYKDFISELEEHCKSVDVEYGFLKYRL